jgi:hypothetical protein
MVKKEKTNCSCIFDGFVGKLGILALILFILQAVFIFSGVFSQYRGIIGNLLIVFLSLIALICIAILYFKFPQNFPAEKRGNLFLVLGMLLFFLGDLVWLIDEVFFKNLVPIGGIADYLWNVGYILFIVAIVYFISFSFRPSKKFFSGLIIIGIIVGTFLVYQDVSEDLELGTFTFQHAVQDMYMVYDIMLVVLIIYLAWPMVFIGNKLFYGMFFMAFGFFTRIGYDRIFAQMSEEGVYYTGHPIDLLYTLLYLILVFKVLYKLKVMCKNG